MTIFRAGNFRFGLMLATALSVSIWSTAGHAYTPEQEQACTGDAFRLCSADIPDISRVTACMVARKSQLSPACRAHFRTHPTGAVLRDGWQFAKRVALSLALRSSGDAGRGFGWAGAAAALVAGRQGTDCRGDIGAGREGD
ncbi:hypothetical protein [Bradyrhizobium paxllaeri]|uniref:hypothetical protein n=1 Tax=Bradyrhizobium paxllaeri TaxID=190148 RepID=UPI001FE290C5|nr:hypothetical protein [Bradyrhizobium paxllaeri]